MNSKSSRFEPFLYFMEVQVFRISMLCFENLHQPKNPAFLLHDSQIYQMSSIYVLRQPHISSIFLPPGTPILWLHADGTICPLAFFPLFRSHFGSYLRPIPVMRPIVVLLVFPLVVGISAVYGSCPNSRFVLFDPHHGLSTLQKHYVLKGQFRILTRKYYETWEMPQGKFVSIFTHVHPNILIFSSVLCSGNPHNLNFAMCTFGTQVAQQLDSDLQPANSPKHATDAGVQWMWERVLCNPPQLILQTFFRVIDYAECHYIFLKINSQIFFSACNFSGIVVIWKRRVFFTRFVDV